MNDIELWQGDCLELMKKMEDNSVDSIVTDPPYGLGFMGKKWDSLPPSLEIFEQALRVLKPGGHLLAFGGSRTYHRLAVAVEDAGFEIRDQIMWVYGSGFPKSHNVSKAIDKDAGGERKKIPNPQAKKQTASVNTTDYGDYGAVNTIEPEPSTKAAQQWDGWGTALKPAHEPIVMARKPFKGNVANNVMEHGTGAINVDGCRVVDGTETGGEEPDKTPNYKNDVYGKGMGGCKWENTKGRFPANLIHDGSDEATDVMGICQKYFYSAKASKKDRGYGNNHPTVKPTELMQYLCRMVTPPNGIVLDPFMGSGSTGKAAVIEGFKFIGIDLEEEYINIAQNRINEVGKDDE